MKPSLTRQVLALLGFLAVCFVAAGFGAAVTQPNVETWYAGLVKPAWTPPNGAFPPVWTALYTLMAVGAWLVWREVGLHRGATPLGIFSVHLLFNVGWSTLFFGLHSPGSALLELVVLWVFILATIISFWRRVPLAGLLLVPYLAWVTFAGALNAAIVWLN